MVVIPTEQLLHDLIMALNLPLTVHCILLWFPIDPDSLQFRIRIAADDPDAEGIADQMSDTDNPLMSYTLTLRNWNPVIIAIPAPVIRPPGLKNPFQYSLPVRLIFLRRYITHINRVIEEYRHTALLLLCCLSCRSSEPLPHKSTEFCKRRDLILH